MKRQLACSALQVICGCVIIVVAGVGLWYSLSLLNIARGRGPLDLPRFGVNKANPGPHFMTVDAVMDDRRTTLTDAQKQAYWQSVQGTEVIWTGELRDASIEGGGMLRLRCNPKSYGSDVRIELDGSQKDTLLSLIKGQSVTVRGILAEHSIIGYQLRHGRISGATVAQPTAERHSGRQMTGHAADYQSLPNAATVAPPSRVSSGGSFSQTAENDYQQMLQIVMSAPAGPQASNSEAQAAVDDFVGATEAGIASGEAYLQERSNDPMTRHPAGQQFLAAFTSWGQATRESAMHLRDHLQTGDRAALERAQQAHARAQVSAAVLDEMMSR
ncbi:MAG: hypothetical protein ACK47B_23550 [Armatimonadota bacterium]